MFTIFSNMRTHVFRCEACGKEHSKRIPPSQEAKPPRYCSNACKHKGHTIEVPTVQYTCEYCSSSFEKKANVTAKRFCSKSCAGKWVKREKAWHIREVQTYVCEGCGNPFEKQERPHGIGFRFCSRKCGTQYNQQHGMLNAFTSFEELLTAGKDDVVEKLREKRRQAALERNARVPFAEATKQKIRETALAGYRDGKYPPQGAPRCKHPPTYKGVRLRSSYELAAIRLLEERAGLTFGETLLYEDPNVRVQWTDAAGDQHTYFPDLHDTVRGTVYEVKPSKFVEDPRYNEETVTKMAALRAAGFDGRYLTEKELKEHAA